MATELLSDVELAKAESSGYVLGASHTEDEVFHIVEGVLIQKDFNPIDRGLVAASILRGHVSH